MCHSPQWTTKLMKRTEPVRPGRIDTSVRPLMPVLVLALALLGVFAPPLAAQEPSPARLRVLCYNIHYGLGTDGTYDIERLARVIEEARPDLVALQEVDVVVRRSGQVHQARRLGELTGMHVRYGPTQHYDGGLYGNAVLSRFPVQDVVIQPLPYSDSTADRTTYPRGAIAVTVRLPNGHPLRFISTHFQHNVPEDRIAEAEAINRLFAVDDDSVPTILAGDMNARPDEQPIQILLEEWSHAMDADATPTAPSIEPRARIDYVFHRGHGTLRVKSSEVLPESVASDHRPVLVEFELVE